MTHNTTQHPKNMRHSFLFSLVGAVVVLSCVIVIGVAVGNVAIPTATVFRIVLAHVGIGQSDVADSLKSIIMTIRLPRVLLVALTSAATKVNVAGAVPVVSKAVACVVSSHEQPRATAFVTVCRSIEPA